MLYKAEDQAFYAVFLFRKKVNVDQLGHATANGLNLQKNLISQSDSPVVSNICTVGGVIIGRSNTPGFLLK